MDNSTLSLWSLFNSSYLFFNCKSRFWFWFCKTLLFFWNYCVDILIYYCFLSSSKSLFKALSLFSRSLILLSLFSNSLLYWPCILVNFKLCSLLKLFFKTVNCFPLPYFLKFSFSILKDSISLIKLSLSIVIDFKLFVNNSFSWM